MSKPRAILYFTRDNTEVAKEVAQSIRLAGNDCNLVYANLFAGALSECNAVIIQASYAKAGEILRAYNSTEIETHYFTDDGEIIEPPAEDLKTPSSFKLPGATANETTEEHQASEDTPAEAAEDAAEAASTADKPSAKKSTGRKRKSSKSDGPAE